MWHQIALTFGPVSIKRLLWMIEYTMRSHILDKEEVGVLLCCFGAESSVTQSFFGCYMLVPRGEVPFLLSKTENEIPQPLPKGFTSHQL